MLPLDPTNENRAWFEELTADAPFPCHWQGLTFLEGLAAKYPDVIDYYLKDGKDRLAALMAQLLAGLGLQQRAGAGEAVAPIDTVEGLAAIYDALNAHDPHYRYGYSVDMSPRVVPAEPFLIAVTSRSVGEAYVTFRIYARFAQAVEERPVPIKLQFRLPADSDVAEALRDFHTYGAPLTIEDPTGEMLSWSVDLPGGLGGDLSGGHLRLGPAHPEGAQPYDLRLQVLDETGMEVATARLRMEPVTKGATGQGMQAIGVEEHGAFGIAIRVDPSTQKVNLSLQGQDLTGRRPTEVLPGLRAAAAFRAPNQFRLAAPYGPATSAPVPIDHDVVLGLGPVIKVVEALAVLQDHTSEQLMVPDLTKTTRREAQQLVRAARLLQAGSYATTWDDLVVSVPGGAVVPDATSVPAGPATFEDPLTVRLQDQEIALGRRRLRLASARVMAVDPDEGGLQVLRFVPGDDSQALVEFVPEPRDSPAPGGL